MPNQVDLLVQGGSIASSRSRKGEKPSQHHKIPSGILDSEELILSEEERVQKHKLSFKIVPQAEIQKEMTVMDRRSPNTLGQTKLEEFSIKDLLNK